MIGGFGGLRPSSARAVLPSPANNNAAANGCNCFQMRYISSSPSRSTRSIVTSSLGRTPLFAVFALVLLGGVLRRRLHHRKIQEPCGVVADELPDGSTRHLQIKQDLRDA